mmetsp:Transcript_32005/g.66814  ORF Transcript_32005/g.66814 Transcript_32005/m.66814 type:complete len:80 (+) Transcript_32005:53-292(+)
MMFPALNHKRNGQVQWFRFLGTIAVVLALEGAFLTFPASPTSSLALQVAHGVILLSIQTPKNVIVHGNDGESPSIKKNL